MVVGTIEGLMGKKTVENPKEAPVEIVSKKVIAVAEPVKEKMAVAVEDTSKEKVVAAPIALVKEKEEMAPSPPKEPIVLEPLVTILETKKEPVQDAAVVDPPSALESSTIDLPLVVLESPAVVLESPPVNQTPLTAPEFISSLPEATRETLLSHITSLESEKMANVLTEQNVLFEQFILDLVLLHAEDIKV